MANLTRWDPFSELNEMRSMMDRMLERAFTVPEAGWQPTWDLPLDMIENNDEYVVKASIPGVNPDDLDITINDRSLTIKGQSKGEDENIEDQHYHLRERWFGSFTRSITLPNRIKSENIQASCENGILTLHLPKTEEVKPKRISVQVEAKKMIEGKVKNNGK
jgi:HSP20 family protein